MAGLGAGSPRVRVIGRRMCAPPAGMPVAAQGTMTKCPATSATAGPKPMPAGSSLSGAQPTRAPLSATAQFTTADPLAMPAVAAAAGKAAWAV